MDTPSLPGTRFCHWNRTLLCLRVWFSMLEYQHCRQDSLMASFIIYATKKSRTQLQIFIFSVLSDMKLSPLETKGKTDFFYCVMCYYPLCGSIQFLQGFPMRCKNLIYKTTLKPPSFLRFWLNIIWYDTSTLKNRVSDSSYGLFVATLAARSFQIVQDVLHFYFSCISGKCESSIWYTAIYSLSNKSYQIRS